MNVFMLDDDVFVRVHVQAQSGYAAPEMTFDFGDEVIALIDVQCWHVADIMYMLMDIRQDCKSDDLLVALSQNDRLRIAAAAGFDFACEILDKVIPSVVMLAFATSATNVDTQYEITREFLFGCLSPDYQCTCPGYHYHNGTCKHVDAVIAAYNGEEHSIKLDFTDDGKQWLEMGSL